MDFSETIQPGMTAERVFPVEELHSALQAGSGGVAVLATPWMIAFMENTAFNLLESNAAGRLLECGVLVEVRHLAPTPIGGAVRVLVEVTDVEDSGVSFGVRAWDESEVIGQGVHRRVVIEKDRFLKRVNAKKIN